MKTSMPFDLEKTIAFWRRPYEVNPAFSVEDIEELEGSLRDRVEALVDQGKTEKEAFGIAIKRMGSSSRAEKEYKKVYWGKLKRERKLIETLTLKLAMLRNYLKIALRNLFKRAGYTAISVLGLTIGIACFLLIGVYIYDEISYDQHHKNASRIYRVTNLDLSSGKQWAPIDPPVGKSLVEYLPGIESVVRFLPVIKDVTLETQTEKFKESDMLYADPSVFEIFTIPFKLGNSKKALSEPYTIVLSEKMAKKYFGKENPIGQTLSLNGRHNLQVTGVMGSSPSKTHLPFDALISMSTFYARAGGDWIDDPKTIWTSFYTYVLLREGSAAEVIEEQFSGFINSFYEPRGAGAASEDRQLLLQPLTSIHLHSSLENELQPNGKLIYIRLLGSMGIFLLLLAIINFINLITARSTERAREVGVRKTLGALHSSLIKQFLLESVLLVGTAFSAAYLLSIALFPLFRQLSGKSLSNDILFEPGVLLVLLGLALILGLLSGSYPAFILARFQPITVLKGGRFSVKHSIGVRESLIVAQFVVAIAFLSGTAIIYQQMQFLTEAALGFDKEQLLNVRVGPSDQADVNNQKEALRNELLQLPELEGVTFISSVPGKRHPLERVESVDNRLARDEGYQMRTVFGAEHNYAAILGLKILRGKNFPDVQTTDSSGAFLVNQAAVQTLGLSPEDAIGSTLHVPSQEYTGTIVGIVEDFHYASLHQQIDPLIVPFNPRFSNGHVLIRVNGQRAEQAIESVKAVWSRLMPGALFDYAFVDTQFDALYRSEMRMSMVMATFSIIALFIACLGLFGLVALIVGQRTKEIGVRKVLGASVLGVVSLLTKDFMRLVVVAFLVAIPISYFVMHRWLEDFAYHTDISGWMFMIVGLITIGISLLTVSIQSIRAAVADPLKSLRYE